MQMIRDALSPESLAKADAEHKRANEFMQKMFAREPSSMDATERLKRQISKAEDARAEAADRAAFAKRQLQAVEKENA